MTESDWQSSTNPVPMLDFLRAGGKAADRKLRLFAVACSRQVWSGIEPLGRAAVETAERFADGLASAEELRAARLACKDAGGRASWYAAATVPAIAARNAALSAQAAGAEAAAQAAILRDIFGPLPFRPLNVSPYLLGWNDGKIAKLAQAIDDARSFERMADLLEDAGCSDAEILGHLRGPFIHVRGCWVVDLLLGKE